MSINYLLVNDVRDFEEIIESPIFIGCDKKLLDKEISHNMWVISFDNKIIKSVSIDTLLEFIQKLLNKRKQQLSELNIFCPVIFYMWFDEMASQLRFNIISYFNEKLPFGCTTNIINSPNPILQAFLASQENPEISWNEFEEIIDDTDDIEEKTFILDIFVKQLNNTGL